MLLKIGTHTYTVALGVLWGDRGGSCSPLWASFFPDVGSVGVVFLFFLELTQEREHFPPRNLFPSKRLLPFSPPLPQVQEVLSFMMPTCADSSPTQEEL